MWAHGHLQQLSNFNQFDVVSPTDFGEKTQNNGQYAVQGNSRTQTLVLVESPYATSYIH